MQSVFHAKNWIIDLLRFLFLDLNDIPGNVSDCHDLICTSSFACSNVDGGSSVTKGGTHYAAHLSKLDGTAAAPWFLLYCTLSPTLVRDFQN